MEGSEENRKLYEALLKKIIDKKIIPVSVPSIILFYLN
jgi:hypothetical protein